MTFSEYMVYWAVWVSIFGIVGCYIEFVRPHVLKRSETRTEPDLSKLFIVRIWDGMDGAWYDVTGPVARDEAQAVWNDRTKFGKEKVSFDEIDYYKIFPADTVMFFNSQNEMCRSPEPQPGVVAKIWRSWKKGFASFSHPTERI